MPFYKTASKAREGLGNFEHSSAHLQPGRMREKWRKKQEDVGDREVFLTAFQQIVVILDPQPRILMAISFQHDSRWYIAWGQSAQGLGSLGCVKV